VIVLDTNVLSEFMKPRPEARVLDWIAREPEDGIFVTVITQAEILRGIAMLPAGRRQAALQSAAEGMFQEDFAGRILAFDFEAAALFARISIERQRAGRPMSLFDGMIAAIVISHGATLATRNLADFADCGARLVNPWA